MIEHQVAKMSSAKSRSSKRAARTQAIRPRTTVSKARPGDSIGERQSSRTRRVRATTIDLRALEPHALIDGGHRVSVLRRFQKKQRRRKRPQ